MADINLFIPILKKFEGGYVNDLVDPGGATNLGITLGTAQRYHLDKDGDGDVDPFDIKLLDDKDLKVVLRMGFWDVCKADYIRSQSVAQILVDWYYNSGKPAITGIQKILSLPQDGNIGKITLDAINAQDPESFFNRIKQARLAFYDAIIANSIAKVELQKGRKLTEKEKLTLTSKKFERGWRNRINEFKFKD